MPVANTEKVVPVNPSDLGQVHDKIDYVLVSYLTSPIRRGTRNRYVLFVTNDDVPDEYNWTFLERDTNRLTEVTTPEGVISYVPQDWGPLTVLVEAKSGDVVLESLTLEQQVISPSLEVEALIDSAPFTDKSIWFNEILSTNWKDHFAIAADPVTTREIHNDFRHYIFEAANKTNATSGKGISAAFLAAVSYKEASWRPKDIPNKYWLVALGLIRPIEINEVRYLYNLQFFGSYDSERSLGVCQMKPSRAAMALGKIPLTEKPKKTDDNAEERENIEKQIFTNYLNLSYQDKLDIFNLLRFPKSNIDLCAKLLTKLKNRPNRYPHLSSIDFQEGEPKPPKIIATEYNLGASTSLEDKAGPSSYGEHVYRFMFGPTIKRSFRNYFAITNFDLFDIDNTQLNYLSADTHDYFDGHTKIHGTVTIEGVSGDGVRIVALYIHQNGGPKAAVTSNPAVSSNLIRDFDATGKIEINAPLPLFLIHNSNFEHIDKSADSKLYLTLMVKSASDQFIGSELTRPLELLVRHHGDNRFGPTRDEARGGDDWTKPSVRDIVAAIPDIDVNDFSNMNGGRFPPHSNGGAHPTGNACDARFTGYDPNGVATAQRLLTILRSDIGIYIEKMFVAYSEVLGNAFYDTIRNEKIPVRPPGIDRDAITVIRPDADHDMHFHMTIRVNS